MSNLRCVNFYDLCRVCTVSSEDKTNVFSTEGKRRNLNSKIAECLSLNIEEKDRLPKVICAQCLQNVYTILEFRKICKNSQTMLANCLSTATLQNGGKVYIKDAIGGSGKSLSVTGTNITNVANLPNSNLQNLPTNLKGNDFINSLIQAVNTQNTSSDSIDKPLMQQYTITLDNNSLKTETPIQSTVNSTSTTATQQKSEKDAKQVALEEFLKMKPNIKVTPLGRKDTKKNQIQHNTIQSEAPLNAVTQEQTAVQQSESQQLQQQQQIAQLQLQQLQQQIQQQIQQQWQQQQLQQQIQQLTSQLQPQPQITITAPSLGTHDPLSPSKNKKPKLNFVLTPPSAQTLSASIPQLATQAPQIQLQLHPSVPLQTTQQQQAAAAALLSNLAPLLQQTQQTQIQNQTQTQSQTSTDQLLQNTVGQSNINSNSLLSPNKCFLPITIKHENSDQQIVAHIDTKNLVLPTTYQLQMKLQPQISMVDGQPIMQLTPTTIPATIQLTPQTLSNQTFQASLNNSSSLQQQLFQHQQQLQSAPQILSQQIIRAPQTTTNATTLINTNDVATSTNDQCEEFVIHDTKITKPIENTQQQETQSETTQQQLQEPQHQTISIAKQKYKITQQPGSNTIEITPTSNFTQQIMNQVQQQQQQKQKQQGQQQHQLNNATSASNQQSGITVHRVSSISNLPLKQGVTMKKIENQKSTSASQTGKLPILNKQNITISRITPQQHANHQPIQSQTTQQFLQTATEQQQKQHSQQSQQKQQSNPIIISDQKLKMAPKMPSTPMKTESQQCEQTQQQHQQIQETQNTQQQQQHQQLQQTQQQQQVKMLKKLTAQQTKLLAEAKQYQESIKIEEEQITEILGHDGTASDSVGPTQTATGTTSALPNRGVGYGNFECTHCGRAFKKKEHLTQHVKLHAGLRPFKCSEEGCDKAFSRKEHLLRHLVSHTGKKMFSCDVCQKPFSRKDNLNKHRRIHIGQPNSNNYVCEICNKAFAVKAYYEQHKESHSKSETSGTDSNKTDTSKTLQPMHTDESEKNDEHHQVNQQQHHQQLQNETQQIHILQQTIQHPNGQHQQQPHQIMHLQLPTVVTTQDLAGNTITITQSHDPNSNGLKTMGNHDTTLLNLPSSLANFVQLGQAQFVNAQTGQIMGHIKIEK